MRHVLPPTVEHLVCRWRSFEIEKKLPWRERERERELTRKRERATVSILKQITLKHVDEQQVCA